MHLLKRIGLPLNLGVAESWDETIRSALTVRLSAHAEALALSPKEREQEFWLPSPWEEGAIHPAIQQRLNLKVPDVILCSQHKLLYKPFCPA